MADRQPLSNTQPTTGYDTLANDVILYKQDVAKLRARLTDFLEAEDPSHSLKVLITIRFEPILTVFSEMLTQFSDSVALNPQVYRNLQIMTDIKELEAGESILNKQISALHNRVLLPASSIQSSLIPFIDQYLVPLGDFLQEYKRLIDDRIREMKKDIEEMIYDSQKSISFFGKLSGKKPIVVDEERQKRFESLVLALQNLPTKQG
jgi:hypothetical protein